MIKCQRCESPRLLYVNGKCKDQCCVHYDFRGKGLHHSPVPETIGLEDNNFGDNLRLTYCLECGQIQGRFPVPEDDVLAVFVDEDEEYWDEDDDDPDDS